MRKLAFLGAGNMAAAMIGGLLRKGVSASDMTCYSASGRTAGALSARTGITNAGSLDELLEEADCLIVAFKPQHLAGADSSLAEFTRGKLVISVLAGKRLGRLAQVFPHARNVVRCMPNTPSKIGAGMTGWCALREITAVDRLIVDSLLGAMGRAVELPESQMDALTGVSGSGPAYVFEFAAALRDAGVAAGLDPATAETLAVETLLGSAKLLAGSKTAPEKLRDEVTSPNGTTFAGLRTLAAGDFRGLIRATVEAARARAEELSRD